jgi:GH25 family lysozyme M1 (1,4-beta-N-acetylmuramidase)
VSDYGIDVSGYNTITAWAAVRTANSWAWAKATQAASYTNPQFAAQMSAGQKAGLAMGAYHFPDPRVSVASNVNRFVSVARPAGAFATGAFLPMLDMENSAGDGITWSSSGANGFVLAFRDALRAATGVAQLCVYAPESWYADGFLQPAQWADSDVVLCAAQYSGRPGVLGWAHPRLAIHQYTDAAPTPGAAGNTDRSVILAPFTLQQLTIGATQRRGGGNMAVFLKNMDVPGAYATQDGPLVSGIRESVGQATLAAWPGASCEIGLNNQEFTDRVNKSKALEGLGAAIAALPAAIAKAIPVGGAGLTADQITAAVAAGVQAGLDGVTETSVLHKPGNAVQQ